MKITKILIAAVAAVGIMAIAAFGETPAMLTSGAPKTMSITVNGVQIEKNAVAAKDSEGNTYAMIPIRAVVERLGGNVVWDDGIVHVDTGEMHTDITIGEDSYVVTTSVEGAVGTSAPFSLGCKPYISKGTTYVHAGLVEALLGNSTDAVTVNENGVSINSKGNVQIPNPITEQATMDEAEHVTGFVLTAPEKLAENYERKSIATICDEIIELNYAEPAGSGLYIRKAVGSDDISGDYITYDKVNSVSVEKRTVTFKGNDGKINLAIWTDGDYTYAVGIDNGISGDAMEEIVKAVS